MVVHQQREGDLNPVSALPPNQPKLQDIPEKLCNLPPFPAVASRIIALANADDPNLREIVRAFEMDPAFAAELLLIANSPLFGFRARINSIQSAVPLLGAARVQALATTVALRSILGRSDEFIRTVWRHGAATAVISQLLAETCRSQAASAYTLGLLHDVGRLALLKSNPPQIQSMLRCSYSGPHEVAALERTIVSVDHSLAGAWLVKTWGFPQVFHDVCLCHHEPVAGEDPELVRFVKLGCRLATALGFAVIPYTEGQTADSLAAEAAQLRPGIKVPTLEAFEQAVTSSLSTFA